MRLLTDYQHDYHPPSTTAARVRVFLPNPAGREKPAAVILVSDPADRIETEVAGEVLFRFALPISRTLFFVERPTPGNGEPGRFDLVTFERKGLEPRLDLAYWRMVLGTPSFYPAKPHEVEDLVGQPLP